MQIIAWLGLDNHKSSYVVLVLLVVGLYSLLAPERVVAQLPQPYLVKDINTRTLRSDPFGFTGVNGVIYFAADDGIHGSELWRTDGTAAGTWLVKDLLPGWQGSSPEQIQADQQGNIYFLTRFSESNMRGLWKSDGTAAGTQELSRGNSYWITVFNGRTFFAQFTLETGEELWNTDGTVAGTKLLKDINPGPASSNVYCTIRIKAALYCYANDGVHGSELWRTDGTTQGTVLLKDINPENVANVSMSTQLAEVPITGKAEEGQAGSTTIRSFALLDDFFYFPAYTPATGWELWRSNGTTEGTVLFKDLLPGSESANPGYFFATPHLVYFTLDRGTEPHEVWRTDGTDAGTYKLTTGNTSDATTIGDTLFFNDCCKTSDVELWMSDGTVAGTHLVKDINPGAQPSIPREMVTLDNKIYFFAQDATHGTELWTSDGTADGTQLVKDLLPGPASPTPAFGVIGYELVAIDGSLYFRAIDPHAGYELWKSDGTAAGTVVVKDIHNSHNESALISAMTLVGEALYFVATDTTGMRALWKADATASHVEPVLPLDETNGSISNLAVISDTLYLVTQTTDGPALVGISDTQMLTIPLQPAPTEYINGCCYPLAVVGNRLFSVVVYNQLNEAGEVIAQEEVIWVSDGTSAGTHLIKLQSAPSYIGQNMIAFQNQLYFIAATTTDPTQLALWRSDGTSAGTVEIKVVPFDRYTARPPYFAVADNQLFFLALTENGGQFALWRSDGTSAGTYAVTPLQFLPCIDFNGFTVYQDELYFCGYDEAHGAELWISNGIAAGTGLAKDINPGVASSHPQPLFTDNSQLFFKATDANHGRELWRSNGTNNGTDLFIDLTPGPQSSDINSALFWGQHLYMTANHAPLPPERLTLWRTDGTAAGTQSLAQVGFGPSQSTPLATTASTFFFIGYTPATGEELWALNATFDQYSFLPVIGQ